MAKVDAGADAEPRLFAVSKKRRKQTTAHAQADAAGSLVVRSVRSAEQHSSPTPAGLTSSPYARGSHGNASTLSGAKPQADQRHSSAADGPSSNAPSAPTYGPGEAAAVDGRGPAAAEPGTADDDPQPPPLPAADTTFRALGVSEWLDRVCRSLGMTQPTQVQAGCIPAILAGRSAIGTAHTGSGKTAAFALPILQLLAADPFGVFALVLTPTRELAFQLAEQFRALGAGMALKDAVIVGGLDMQAQARQLAARPHVVVATPGRLRGLLTADPALAEGFARSRFLVLDEADRLLEPTFEGEMRVIAEALPPSRQTLLFSATMTASLVAMQKHALQNAFHFQAYEGLQTVSKLRQEYVFIPSKVKEVYLFHLLGQLPELGIRSTIIFASTCKVSGSSLSMNQQPKYKEGAHMLGYVLEELGLQVAPLHSHLNQRRRLAALHRFKSGVVPILLATDVASRGLDIPTVDLVVNFDLPIVPRDYVHRVGRTARAGRGGWSLSFVTQYDVELVHQVEAVVATQLAAYEMSEKEVLKGITKVFTAKRAAAVRVAEEQGTDRERPQRLSHDAKARKRQRQAAAEAGTAE